MSIEVRLKIGEETAREYHFEGGDIILGCHPFNDLVVANSGLAARHGRIRVLDGALRYEDLGSGKGTRVRTPAETLRLKAESRNLSEGDVLVLGRSNHVEITILAWAHKGEPRVEAFPITQLPPSEALFTLDEELRGTILDGSAEVLLGGGLSNLSQLFDDCIQQILPDDEVSASIVLPQGERGFHDLVVVCSGDCYQAEFLTPDSAHLIKRLVTGTEAVVVYDPTGPTEFNLPFVDTQRADPLAAYLRITTSKPLSTEASMALAKLGCCLRPTVLTLLRLESLGGDMIQLEAENAYFRARSRRHYLFKELVTESENMRRMHRRIQALLTSDSPVMVFGEAGSGKKMVGRALHHLGSRRNGMFIAQNCAELSADELDRELFGLAATDAGEPSHKSIFELSDGGTIFIDEVDRLPPHLQTKLVRVLREREVRREGDEVGRPVDVRVVVGTHRDLEALVRSGAFRADLFGAFGRNRVDVPPMRERKEDIIPLAEHFVVKYARRYGRDVLGLTDEASERLLNHPWPGNVRELQVVVETAVLNTTSGPVGVEQLRI